MTTLAIDIGGTKIAAAVCDENDSIIQRWRVPTPMDADAINQHIAEVYREAVAAGHTDIEAIGISAAGNVSADRKTLTFSANIPAWINYDLSEHVGALIDHAVPVVVENDANCAGWGEYVHGAGQGSSNMVALTVGTGLGGAIVINGQLYRGSFGMAAELGHLPMTATTAAAACAAAPSATPRALRWRTSPSPPCAVVLRTPSVFWNCAAATSPNWRGRWCPKRLRKVTYLACMRSARSANGWAAPWPPFPPCLTRTCS